MNVIMFIDETSMTPMANFRRAIDPAGGDWEPRLEAVSAEGGTDNAGGLGPEIVFGYLSALGAYVHDVLVLQIGAQLGNADGISEKLAIAIRDACVSDVPESVPSVSPQVLFDKTFADIAGLVAEQLIPGRELGSIDQLETAFQLIGVERVLEKAAGTDRDAPASASEIRSRLEETLSLDAVIRRRCATTTSWRADPAIAGRVRNCTRFVVDLVARLDRVVNADRAGTRHDRPRLCDDASQERGGDVMSARSAEDSRSELPGFIAKMPVRVKVHLVGGRDLIGDCHVLAPNGRVSDVVNDDRPFLIMTRVKIEDDTLDYDVVTISKDAIEMLLEFHRA